MGSFEAAAKADPGPGRTIGSPCYAARMLSRAILSACAAASLAGCGGQAANDAAPESNDSNLISLPAIPVPAPPMDRAALLMAAMKAASAAATGADDREAQRTLDGNRFEVRLRFGCDGPAARENKPSAANPQTAMNWSFDPEHRTLRVRAEPDASKADPTIAALAGQTFEAVEGFWVPRPWLLQAACPVSGPAPADQPTEGKTAKPGASDLPASEAAKEAAGTTDAKAPAPAPAKPVHSIAIAQFFSPTDSRIGRRDDRPYEATRLLDEGVKPSSKGYNLVLSGRLKRLPGGRAIVCRPISADRPPQCVVSANFDRVWIERPDTRAIVAEWASGG
jgi:hypothetical protein